jgi:hypothetical protein
MKKRYRDGIEEEEKVEDISKGNRGEGKKRRERGKGEMRAGKGK